MTYAAMIFVAIAIGVWVVAKAGGITGDPLPPVVLVSAVLWVFARWPVSSPFSGGP